MTNDPIPAYDDLLVVDCSRRMSGAFAARLFADHGADVVMLEPPEGHPLRHEAPFLDGQSGPERSALHAYVNWNKRSRVISEPSEAEEWIAAADIVITTDGPAGLSQWPLDALPPSAVHLSVTPFGLDSDLSDAPAGNLTLNARCGWAHVNALRDEPPLSLPNRQSGFVGGLAAFVAGAAALQRRDEHGEPELVDVRELEALVHTVYPWTIGAIYQGTGWSRGATGGRPRGEPGPLWDAADGRMNFGFGDWHHWREAMALFNLPIKARVRTCKRATSATQRTFPPSWPASHASSRRCKSGPCSTNWPNSAASPESCKPSPNSSRTSSSNQEASSSTQCSMAGQCEPPATHTQCPRQAGHSDHQRPVWDPTLLIPSPRGRGLG